MGEAGIEGEDDVEGLVGHGNLRDRTQAIDGPIVPDIGCVLNDIVPTFYAMTTVGILIYPDFQLLDATGPAAAFEAATESGSPSRPYVIHMLAPGGGLVRSSCGIAVATTTLAAAPALDTLIVAGGAGSRAAASDPTILDFIA